MDSEVLENSLSNITPTKTDSVSPDSKYQEVLKNLQSMLNSHEVSRVGIIDWVESKLMWGKHQDDKKTPEERERSGRVHAVEMVLEDQYLQRIQVWDEKIRDMIANTLYEYDEDALTQWINDPVRFKLDPERVEQMEEAIRKKLKEKTQIT